MGGERLAASNCVIGNQTKAVELSWAGLDTDNLFKNSAKHLFLSFFLSLSFASFSPSFTALQRLTLYLLLFTFESPSPTVNPLCPHCLFTTWPPISPKQQSEGAARYLTSVHLIPYIKNSTRRAFIAPLYNIFFYNDYHV